MKQIIMQNRKTGEVSVVDTPIPLCSSNNMLVKTVNSLISIGTERSVIELGQKSLLGKARTRPDLLKRFVNKAKNEGLLKTLKTAMQMLDVPTSLGYSSAGLVVEVGGNTNRFSPGDRVACIGAGYATHSEYVNMPENLTCIIPDNVSFEEASFGMLGIIAMHGVRCANLTVGETVAVIGLGLLGQLAVQILRSYGFRVIGIDLDSEKVELSKKFNIDYACQSEDEFRNAIDKATKGYGADAVIITAATDSDQPINLSVDIARFRARIVVIGVADIHPSRNEMWHKEVEIIVSKASGPGIFDPFYENKGIDYPPGYVRWTENRNLEEFLRLVSNKSVDVISLISHRMNIDEAELVYKDIVQNKSNKYVGVVLKYPESKISSNRRIPILKSKAYNEAKVSLGVVGAGLFGNALLLPELKGIDNIRRHTMSTASSANAYHSGVKHGFENCTTDYKDVLNTKDINAVIIITPHSVHSKMVVESLNSGKHVFVEKPLCVKEEELNNIASAYYARNRNGDGLYLMVGYNRRFSPHAIKAFEYFRGRKDPMVINYRVNAGYVPSSHWVHSEEEGGSRVIGEMCHFVDMMQMLTGSDPETIFAERIRGNNLTAINSDNIVVTIKFSDGSVGSLIYSASGDKAFNRELIEIFCEGKTVVVRDFKITEFYHKGRKKTFKTFNQDSGYKNELKHFFDVIIGKIRTDYSPDVMFRSTQAVFAINSALETSVPQKIKMMINV